MRIAYLVSQYPAVNHTHILREITGLRRTGFEIAVASVSSPDRPDAALTAEERSEAARTFYIKRTGLPGALVAHAAVLVSHPLLYLRALAAVLRDPRDLLYFTEALIAGRWMRRNGLAHVHSVFSSTVALFIPRIFPGLTVSMSIHGSAEFYEPVSFRLAEKIRVSGFVRGISHYGASQLLRVSDYREWSKIEVVRLGVDPAVYTPRPFRERPAPLEILCVGQLAPSKGQHMLVDAIALLTRSGRGVRLRLAGNGPDEAALREHVRAAELQQHVIFEGARNADEVLDLFRRTDVFALPSFAEGIPVVLMEAMSMEIPCVATRITGIPELMRDGVDGLLVPPADADALAQAISALHDDPALRRRLGEAGRVRVLEHYNLSRNVESLATVFRARLGAARSSAVR